MNAAHEPIRAYRLTARVRRTKVTPRSAADALRAPGLGRTVSLAGSGRSPTKSDLM